MFTLNDILQGNANKISLLSDQSPNPDMVFRSAHHDSRQIGPGDLFVALKGARVDGHRFISTVAETGQRQECSVANQPAMFHPIFCRLLCLMS